MQDHSYFPVLDWRSYAIHCTLLRQKYFCQLPEVILCNALKFCECLNVSCSREEQHKELFSNYWVDSETKWTKCRVVLQLSWGVWSHISVLVSLYNTNYTVDSGVNSYFWTCCCQNLWFFAAVICFFLGCFFNGLVILLSCFLVLSIHLSSLEPCVSIWNYFQILVNPFFFS